MAFNGILDDRDVIAIQDPETDVKPIADTLINKWICDIENRRPSPADVENGQLTDLDLCTFLFTLSKRNAMVEIPNFKSLRPSTNPKSRNQKIVGPTRFGRIKNFVTNEETLNVSLQIDDGAVLDYDKNQVGSTRNFTITDFDGSLYEGWSNIVFQPDAKENQFIFESGILTDDKIVFDKFVHPNSWIRMFSKDYLKIKLLDQRITQEMKVINKLIKEKKEKQKKEPYNGKSFDKKHSGGTKEPSKKIDVEAFVVKLHGIDIPKDGYEKKYERLALKMLQKEYNFFRYILRAELRFIARVGEIGHYKRPHILPSWLKEEEWVPGFKETPQAKTYYESLIINDEYSQPIRLLRRTYLKSTEVNINYE